MSRLIQIRNRIKAVHTIKKITHAMRLIAMSTNSKLRDKKVFIENYTHQIETLIQTVQAAAPNGNNPFTEPTGTKKLLIIVGSQKGLCGNFNSLLFKFIDTHFADTLADYTIISVGKKAADYCAQTGIKPIAQYNNLTIGTRAQISKELAKQILPASPTSYASVLLVANRPVTFFKQMPTVTVLIPADQIKPTNTLQAQDYIWPQDPDMILQTLTLLHITARIEFTLFESLLAEQAARFISMDNSTRNANNLLISLKLNYNKLRQAKITQEISEIASSF